MTNSTWTAFITSSLIAAATLWSGAAAPEAGVQISPDGKQTLISKDVSSERWAIALNAEDSSVTGNVFFADGGEPRFVSCEQTGTAVGGATYHCLGADRCPLGPCAPEDWVLIADVTLPDTFFLPPLDFATVIGSTTSTLRRTRANGDRPSGVQTSPDGERTLISKDVGAERWAITRDEKDGSVTGNVFFPAGGDPLFVWCEQVGREGDQLGLACYGADSCIIAPCPREDWKFIANVALQESFFAPPESVSVEYLVGTLVDTMGDEDAFIAIVSALDKGYSFRQISRAGLSGRLLVSGDIENRSGGFETPENPPQGLFALAARTDRIQATLPPPPQLYVDFGEAVGQDERTKVITRLLDQGYSLRQVGDVSKGATDVIDCTLLADPAQYRACVEKYGGTIVIVGPGDSKISPDDKAPDVMNPEPRTPCGNGRIDGGEDCDGAALRDETCVTRGFGGGDLRCDDVCRFDTSRCRKTKCGDGYADEGELCDGADVRGKTCPDIDGRFVGGRLLCSNCVFDTRECDRQPQCGNGLIERVGDRPLEECDGPDLDGKRCSDFSPYVAGLLRCNSDCHLDFSGCTDAGETDCGNGVAEGNEQCDRADRRGLDCVSAGDLFTTRGFVGGTLGCDEKCRLILDECTTKEDCGNGVAEGREYCDGGDLGGATCQTVHRTIPVGPFSGGTLACDDRCRWVVDQCILMGQCNDGVRDAPFEECDRSDFGDHTCERDFGRGGNLICTADCHIDPRSCQREQHCGDDFAEGTEQCDGFDLRGVECEDLGYLGGTLACGKDCLFDTSKCAAARCGDGIVDGDEQCDGINLQGKKCENLGFGGGTLYCATDCRFDTSQCTQPPVCGNGIPEGTEECDGSTVTGLRGQTCTGLGFAGGGTLNCYTNCTYDTRACEEEPRCTEQTCPDGSCAPYGADCCGGGNFCYPGDVCVEGGCCPSSQPIVCAGLYCMPAGANCCGSTGWCSAGTVCVVDGCCPAGTPKSCLDGTCTTEDSVCCGNGTSCPAGTQCLPGGGCG